MELFETYLSMLDYLLLVATCATARSAPPPAPAQGGGSMLGGIGATIADG